MTDTYEDWIDESPTSQAKLTTAIEILEELTAEILTNAAVTTGISLDDDRRVLSDAINSLREALLLTIEVVTLTESGPNFSFVCDQLVSALEQSRGKQWREVILNLIQAFNNFGTAFDDVYSMRTGGHASGNPLLRSMRNHIRDASGSLELLLLSAGRLTVDRILEDTRAAAGEVGELNLAIEFKTVADNEERQANAFRLWTIAMFPAALSVAVYIVGRYGASGFSSELVRLAVDVPILAAAFYFSSEAKDHRTNARRARELQIRLSTVNAYTEPLPESQKNQIRTALGMAVYKEPGALPSALTMSELTDDLLHRVVEIVKAARN